ncbi:hypothetical protein Tco_0001909 [Tanacetum coccineum]
MREGAAKHGGDEANDLESKGVRWRLPWAARVVTRSLQGDDNGAWFELCTLPTQGMRSIISMVSICPEVVVAIIGVVIVVTIIGVVVVVMIIGVVGVVVVSSIIKLSFVIIGSLLSIVLCYLIH